MLGGGLFVCVLHGKRDLRLQQRYSMVVAPGGPPVEGPATEAIDGSWSFRTPTNTSFFFYRTNVYQVLVPGSL